MSDSTLSNAQALFFEQALPRCLLSIGRYRIELLNWGRIVPHQWYNQDHSHSFFELCYVHEGMGEYLFKGERHAAQPGDLLIAYPGEEHSLRADAENPFGVYCASFGVYSGGSEREGELPELSGLVERFLAATVRVAQVPKLDAVCRLISDEILQQEPGYELSLPGLFTKFFFGVLNATGGGVSAPRGAPAHRLHPQELRLRKAVLYIENNYHTALRVKDVADRMFISQRQANRMFQQAFGMPVMHYIQDFRLKVAKQMLDNTGRPIKEVAWACGYPNERNFMTLFRKQTGQTANEFRRRRSES